VPRGHKNGCWCQKDAFPVLKGTAPILEAPDVFFNMEATQSGGSTWKPCNLGAYTIWMLEALSHNFVMGDLS